MDTTQVIELLIKEAEGNAASNAVFHVFALRQRARSNINLTSLYNKMKKEKFSYSKSEYISVLKLLSTLGFGELQVDSRGKVRGLKNIKVNLQSIGKAACKQSNHFIPYKPRNKFVELPPVKIRKINNTPPKTDTPVHKSSGITIAFNINGKAIDIPIPPTLTTNEIAQLVNKLQSA